MSGRPGRPRHVPSRAGQTPREEILEIAARLFVRNGFANTSTRVIAEEVGIRQASLYYHFQGKDDILGELLDMTVRPTLDSLDNLDKIEGDDARLYALAFCDAGVLANLMHNIGVLPGHPDVARTPECEEYKEARRQLQEAYSALGVSCASAAVLSSVDKNQLGGIILQSVESVIGTRADGDVVTEGALHAVAAACLRLCGVPQERIDAAASALPPVPRIG